MAALDARHIELFQVKDTRMEAGIMSCSVPTMRRSVDGASAGIFDVKHLKDCLNPAVLDLKSWIGKPNDWQPKALITPYAVAVNTNLQENEGLHMYPCHEVREEWYDFLDSICGNNPFEIRFPFGIEGQNLQNCSYPGFSLRCSSQGRSILSLPGAGDYYNAIIREIQCFDSPGTGSKKGRQVFKFIAITLVIPAITCLVGVSCYICLGYRSSYAAALNPKLLLPEQP
ncbi:hypothetical protein HAX54_011591 [Datura stramonium]|uniref:Wall-associated receptor kinase galacturonan-binding domain-containing protein n=1 Tax=Datura stramonium TaxID=4076 RepID=A0ABS8TL33_DATST|nr:hypothetical protein [Datura stramonium]